jgi:UDP-N-acetylglucosamine diphosphorylase/glucosamine-1-phosphate N-acetyltransferase
MNLILFDGLFHQLLKPVSYTRPVAEIRVGALTIKEKWEKLSSKSTVSYLTAPYLSEKYPANITEDNVVINAAVIPSKDLLEEVIKLEPKQRLIWNKTVLAYRLSKADIENGFDAFQDKKLEGLYSILTRPQDIFRLAEREIKADYKLLATRSSQQINSTNQVLGSDLYVEEGAEINAAILNTKTGPIYIGKNVQIMEGAMLRGPIAIMDNAVVKMGAKIYSDTVIGPHCKVGGEVSNVIFQAYSNKGHDGYLGNSYIGAWCNLGADTNCSNLKNNYSEVRAFSYASNQMENTGLTFCGLVMGDHSKTSINTMINTGTTVGVCANLFGSGFPDKFVPSFSWGFNPSKEFQLAKAFEVADRMMSRRGFSCDETEQRILSKIFEKSAEYRN